ncbi:hypothetical protein, partial [Saccharopolyspora erythraea]|uniref:hypothetical protein n=1 Tax=Saccharopolyspora erythraea TaxID=1836 RepID=UPI00055E8C71
PWPTRPAFRVGHGTSTTPFAATATNAHAETKRPLEEHGTLHRIAADFDRLNAERTDIADPPTVHCVQTTRPPATAGKGRGARGP